MTERFSRLDMVVGFKNPATRYAEQVAKRPATAEPKNKGSLLKLVRTHATNLSRKMKIQDY